MLIPAILIGVVIGIPTLILWIMRAQEFFDKLSYLNIEISRKRGEEQRRYKKMRREHLLSLIPFYGRIREHFSRR